MRILTDPIKIAVAFFSSTGVNIVLLTLEQVLILYCLLLSQFAHQ